MEEFEPARLTEIAKVLSKTTNVTAGGYGLFSEMEKYIKNQLH
jgi:hypothetical protein